jgi:hypothetical protein
MTKRKKRGPAARTRNRASSQPPRSARKGKKVVTKAARKRKPDVYDWVWSAPSLVLLTLSAMLGLLIQEVFR